MDLDKVQEIAEKTVLETYNETFLEYPNGGKITNEAFTEALVLFFKLGVQWKEEQDKK